MTDLLRDDLNKIMTSYYEECLARPDPQIILAWDEIRLHSIMLLVGMGYTDMIRVFYDFVVKVNTNPSVPPPAPWGYKDVFWIARDHGHAWLLAHFKSNPISGFPTVDWWDCFMEAAYNTCRADLAEKFLNFTNYSDIPQNEDPNEHIKSFAENVNISYFFQDLIKYRRRENMTN